MECSLEPDNQDTTDSRALRCCLNLMRRLPPNRIAQNFAGLSVLRPDLTDELLQRIDQPLHHIQDPDTSRMYVLCDYNRDGDSFRSPWSNKYYPPLEHAFYPSEQLRALEVEANELFDIYRQLYYEGGTSSVYLWDLDHGFAGCYVIKKDVTDHQSVKKGGWDSTHVIEVIPAPDGKSAVYKLTTTVIVHMSVAAVDVGDTDLSGNVTRQAEAAHDVDKDSPHLANMGRMIEDMEIQLRSDLDQIYLGKTKEMVSSLRSVSGAQKQKEQHITNLMKAVSRHRISDSGNTADTT